MPKKSDKIKIEAHKSYITRGKHIVYVSCLTRNTFFNADRVFPVPTKSFHNFLIYYVDGRRAGQGLRDNKYDIIDEYTPEKYPEYTL